MLKLILIVEDDPKSLKLTRDLLQLSGYETIEATDGKQGVELAKAKKPDLILMDILMPGMDGYAACHILKTNSETQGIPLVMLSAVNTELSKDATKGIGADAYITKPFTHEELLGVISRFLPTP
ncbi:PleD family two-component system response regulator [Chloroflexota bacterium]